ncbi:MAG TPA: cellulose synthase subunit BcsC-related outer membrane protein, partial [Alphaproteobacteria bacterium]|nr:cellulose synthase subunit BcsC-related outer membrane protein [Alphaproteobacteria bacterium]
RLNAANRVTFVYQPTLYTTNGPSFNTNYFGTSLDSEISDRLSSHIRAGAEVFHNTPVGIDGGVDLRFKPVPSTSLRVGFQRQPLQESLLSLPGVDFGGQVFGHVYSNLPSASVSYENREHAMDASLTYTDGVYTGDNVDSNRRYSLESQLGKSLRSDRPYMRVAYSVNYTSFDHDADLQTGQPITRLTGGYFSPTRFLLNQGVLNLSHSFTRNMQWTANGAAGVQNVETSTASFSNTQFASSFDTHLMWRFTPSNELRVTYDYLNVFNAFQRNYFRFSWRHYL